MSKQIHIDGEPVTVQNAHCGVDALVAAAGLDWRKYDLLRVGSNGQAVTYRAGETIDVRDGDEFFAARVSATNA